MKFAFLVMGEFEAAVDRAKIHEGNAQIIGVSSVEEACEEAKRLAAEGIGCIELCGAFRAEGAKKVIEATNNTIPIGYVVHLPEQDEVYRTAFPNDPS